MFDELNQAAEHTYPAAEPAQAPQKTEAEKEAQKEASHRVLRDRAEAAERRALELERMIQQNMAQQQPNKIQLVDNDDGFDISDDTYVEGKHLKKYIKSLKQEVESTKKKFEDYNAQNSLTQAEMRLRAKYSDFDNVVTKENLDKLAAQKPALYKAIFASTDIYDRGDVGYEVLQASGILNNQYQDLDKRVEENKNKPRSAANASPQSGDTPLARVGDYDRRILSEERKDQLRRQVEQAKMLKQ